MNRTPRCDSDTNEHADHQHNMLFNNIVPVNCVLYKYKFNYKYSVESVREIFSLKKASLLYIK